MCKDCGACGKLESREQITGGGNVSGTCLRGTCRKDGFLSVDKVSRATVENESCSARTCAPQVDPTGSMFTSACQSSRPLWVTTLSSPAPLILPSNLSLLLSEPCQPLPFISTLLSMQISTNPIIKPLEAGNGSTVYWGLPTPPRDCIASSGLTVLALHWLTKATLWNLFSISVGEDEHNSYPIIGIVISFSTSVTMSHLLLN